MAKREITHLSTLRLALVFLGLFLGAGYVSGQELMQYFGVFGYVGIAFLAAAIGVSALISGIVVTLVHRTGYRDIGRVAVQGEIPWLRRSLTVFSDLFLYVCTIVMIAGGGSLFGQLVGWHPVIGSAGCCLILYVIAVTGKTGVVNALNLTTPLMVVASVLVCVFVYSRMDPMPVVNRFSYGENPLIGNLLLSTISFVSYNMLPNIAIIITLSDLVKSQRTLKRGLSLGAVILIGVSLLLIMPVIQYMPLVGDQDMPMLALASMIGPWLAALYTLPLFAGVLGTAAACLFSFLDHTGEAWIFRGRARLPISLAGVVLGSMIGFRQLVVVVYPIFGYIGLVVLAGIFHHYWKLSRADKAVLAQSDTNLL